MNRASVIGIILGIAAVAGGSYLESGRLSSILQPTAALIVFGGTLGATLLSFPLSDVLKAGHALRQVFLDDRADPRGLIDDLVRYAGIARRSGLIALDGEIRKIEDPFFRKSMTLALDHMNPKMLRETMEQDNITSEMERRRLARVYETAGGFAPTIGIIGAVLGLIHVMENLAEPARLGSGIAVAFVATIYGVGSANLILLPIAKKLINRMNQDLAVREMIVEGVIGIQAGMNPHYLRERLGVFLEEREEPRTVAAEARAHRKKERVAGTTYL